MVGILFWSIYFYDRELILPKVHDLVYPCELNMYQHGFIAVIMWFEWLFFYHDIEFKKHTKLIVTFGVVYTCWLYSQKYIFGEYPYPLFEAMNLYGHVTFVSCSISMTVVIFYVLSHIHKLRWRALIQQQMEKQQKPLLQQQKPLHQQQKPLHQQQKPIHQLKEQFEMPQQPVFDKQEKDFVKRSPSLTFS